MHRVVFVRHAGEQIWRGTIDRRERLRCAMAPDAAFTVTYTLELADRSTLLLVICAISLDGIVAEANVTMPARRGVAETMAAARAAALRRLVEVVTNEIDECDARFRALVDGETRWWDPADAAFDPPTLMTTGTDGRGSYASAHAVTTARMAIAGGHGGGGYLAMPGLTRGGARNAIGTYGASAAVAARGYIPRGYMPDNGRRAAYPGGVAPLTRVSDGAATLKRRADIEALGLALLRLQTLLTALDGALAAHA